MTMAGEKSRSAQRERTRSAIVDAAFTLFTRLGYRAVSLRDIAAEAGISHPALLKYYSGKEELLACVLQRLEEDSGVMTCADVARGSIAELPFSLIARSNIDVVGYLPFFSALVGEAAAPSHPAHETMRARAASLRPHAAAIVKTAQEETLVGDGREPEAESMRLLAAWDALQVIEQYLPGRVDVVRTLERHEGLLSFPFGWRAPSESSVAGGDRVANSAERVRLVAPSPPEAGYRSGRARRERILADAMTLFAREGYANTSLREIAERVGVSKSALYHHFASKDALLLGVLEERDRQIDENMDISMASGASALRAMPHGALSNERDAPGLIEVYAVISCEALPSGHPAHSYFTRRFSQALDSFTELFREAAAAGDLPEHRDPEHEALWLLALWDGLQYHWLYDRDSVDIAAHLRAHLEDVLPPR